MKKLLLLIPVLLLFGYLIWSNLDRQELDLPTDAQFRDYQTIGIDSGRGNLIGIQPFMVTADYSSEKAFYKKMDGYFAQLKQRHWLNSKSIVVLPEYLGTWLVTVNEKHSVYTSPSSAKALQTMALSNLGSYASAYLSVPDSVKVHPRYAIFKMKAEIMAKIYGNVFKKIASTYQVHIVAGSILLPNPKVENNEIIPQDGLMYNVSAVFRPNGSIAIDLVKKSFPIAEEQAFLAASPIQNLPSFDTPAGKLGVLICADSWFQEGYQVLKQKGVKILAVPSFCSINFGWQIPWTGYSGWPTPAQAKADIGILTEGQAWLKYAMVGKAFTVGNMQAGMNVFLKGQLWDFGFDGRTTSTLGTKSYTDNQSLSSTATCLWL